ncbi:MAG: enoyl-CoA hydratase/isomerase family protein [Pseudomonadales bacterium]
MNEHDATILYHVDNHVATITLNCAERHNSLGCIELEKLTQHFADVKSDEQIRVLVLTGAGERTFCAGAALDQLSSGKISPEMFSDMTSELAGLRVPTVCALNGSVYGGGCEVALSCDFRLGNESMRAFIPAAKFGLCFPPSGIERLVMTLGLGNAQKFLLTANEFNAKELLAMGFLTDCYKVTAVRDETNSLANILASRAPLAVQAMKNISLRAANRLIDDAQVNAWVTLCNESSDLEEGFLSLREKRAAKFTGH